MEGHVREILVRGMVRELPYKASSAPAAGLSSESSYLNFSVYRRNCLRDPLSGMVRETLMRIYTHGLMVVERVQIEVSR